MSTEKFQKCAGAAIVSTQATNHRVVSGDVLLRYCSHRNKTDVQCGSTFF